MYMVMYIVWFFMLGMRCCCDGFFSFVLFSVLLWCVNIYVILYWLFRVCCRFCVRCCVGVVCVFAMIFSLRIDLGVLLCVW